MQRRQHTHIIHTILHITTNSTTTTIPFLTLRTPCRPTTHSKMSSTLLFGNNVIGYNRGSCDFSSCNSPCTLISNTLNFSADSFSHLLWITTLRFIVFFQYNIPYLLFNILTNITNQLTNTILNSYPSQFFLSRTAKPVIVSFLQDNINHLRIITTGNHWIL